MKSSEIALKYNLDEYILKNHIRSIGTIPYKENFWGEYIIPDDVDIEALISSLILKKEEASKKVAEERLRRQQKEYEEQIENQKRQQAEHDRQEQARQQREEFEQRKKEELYHLRIENLRSKRFDGYYEYKVISLSDVSGLFKSNSGRVNTEGMTEVLNELGIDGWHLVTAYSNELGKNALSGGAGGVLMGINSTIDENILIFERFVRI